MGRVQHLLSRRWTALVAIVFVVSVGVALSIVFVSGSTPPESVEVHDIQVGPASPGASAFFCTPGPCSASAIASLRAGLDKQVTFVVAASGPTPEPTCTVAIAGHGRSVGPIRAYLVSFGNDTFAWSGTASFSHRLRGVAGSDVRVACST